jgi:hypothetical protein
MALPRRDTACQTYADYLTWFYRLEGNAYGRPAIHETKGALAVAMLPDILIDWERVLPAPPLPDA